TEPSTRSGPELMTAAPPAIASVPITEDDAVAAMPGPLTASVPPTRRPATVACAPSPLAADIPAGTHATCPAPGTPAGAQFAPTAQSPPAGPANARSPIAHAPAARLSSSAIVTVPLAVGTNIVSFVSATANDSASSSKRSLLTATTTSLVVRPLPRTNVAASGGATKSAPAVALPAAAARPKAIGRSVGPAVSSIGTCTSTVPASPSVTVGEPTATSQ